MTSASLKEFTDSSRKLRVQIDQELDRHSTYDSGCPDVLRNAIRHSLLAPGKRLRPMLVLLAAEACGSDRAAAMPAACAVEMVHTYSLIHDDLPAMDDDDFRRGRPSCHAAFGEAMAILAGDALLARAFEILAQGVQPAAVAARCCAALGHAAGASTLVGGQVDDIKAENKGGDIALLERIHKRKTGAMFNVALYLGGLVAQADDEQMTALATYGMKLGMAFQIVDDVLDLRGDEESMGKRLGKDSARGKLTFPCVLGLEESERRAHNLVEDACAALVPLGDRAKSLNVLARYVIQRSR